MGLQLRVRHSLGARMIEIDERGPDRPILVGRDASCDVQIPSGAVAPTHAMLYSQEGQWVVADAASGAGTFINGHLIDSPSYVNFGDTISLGPGSSAPRIEIDPLGAARRGAAARAAAVAAARPPAPGEGGSAVDGPASNGGWSAPPEGSEPAVPSPSAITDDTQGAEDEQWGLDSAPQPTASAWPTAGSGVSYAGHRRPRRQQSNLVPLGIALAVVIVLGGIIAIYVVSNRQEPAPKPAPNSVHDENASPSRSRKKKNIFDDQPVQRTPVRPPRVATADNTAAPAPQTPATGPQKAVEALDPRKQTDEWRNIESAHDGNDPARTIWAASDYMELHPGQFESELKGYIADALDQLWWMRIRDLCEQRDRLDRDLSQTASDIAAEAPGSEFIKTLETRRKNLEFEKSNVLEILTQDMGYAGMETPNPNDQSQIDRLRRGRNAARFEAWCKSVLNSIRKTRDVPWVRSH